MDELNQIEKEKIVIFNADEVLCNAVRKVLLASFYTNGTLRKEFKPNPLRNGALGLAMMAVGGTAVLSNETLGEDIRGIAQAINLMEVGFQELAKIKNKEPSGEPEVNPGI